MSELHRHLGLAGYAARNLARLWRRSLAVGVPLALAIAVATAATLVADGIRQDAALAASYAPDLTVQRMAYGRLSPIAVGPFGAVLAARPEVAAVRPRVFTLVPAPGDESTGALATVLGVDWAAAGEAPYGVVEGRLPAPGETGVVVLGRGVAASLRPGATWRARGPGGVVALEVVGLLSDAVAIHGANLALTSLEDARALAGLAPDEASELAVTLAPGAREGSLADHLQTQFEGVRVVGKGALGRILDAIYGSRSGAFVTVWLILLLVSPAAAWALGMSVAASERHEMGVLKALGWSTLELVEARMIEGGLLGLAATLAGALAGTLYALGGAPGIAGLFEGWAALYPTFRAPLAVDPRSALALFAAGIVPLLAAMAVPAWRIGSTPPETVMRD
ncbi:MAG: ABC transporter permease [Myxococcales bacterium]|nr:ABC transporter permease [Myxococcales bacterium]